MKTQETKILAAITVIATLLRLFAIGQRDFWYDEAFTYHIAKLPIENLFKAVLTDNNPPLYYLLIHFVLNISSNDAILRLPSVIANVASIILLYTMLKKFINRMVGLIASALFSVSPLAIYIATEARLHSIAMLMAVLLTSLFLKLIKNGKPLSIALFILTASLGLYTQYYIVLLFLPFTWIVLRYKTSITFKQWVLVAGSTLVILLPWLFMSLLTTHNICSCPSTFLSLPASLVSPALGGIGEVTLRLFPNIPLPILLLFGATAFITLFLLLKGLMQSRLISLLYLVPLGTLSFLGLFLPVFSPKAFAIFSPFYFAIVALGITSYGAHQSVGRHPPKHRRILPWQTPWFSVKADRKSGLITLILAALLGTISLIQIVNPFFAGTRLKPLNNIVKENPSITVAHTSLVTYYSLDYYSQGNQKHILITQNPLSVETLKFIGGQKQQLNVNPPQLWLVDTEKWTEVKDRKNALKIIFDTYSVEKTYKVDRITVSLLKRK